MSNFFNKLVVFLVLGLALVPVHADDEGLELLDATERQFLRHALYSMNMTEGDLGFEKDHGKPEFVLESIRRLLSHPLDLPPVGEKLLRAVQEKDVATFWPSVVQLLECESDVIVFPARKKRDVLSWDGVDASLAQALTFFMVEMEQAHDHLMEAFHLTSEEDRRFLACSYLAGIFNAEDFVETRETLYEFGWSSNEVQKAIEESLEINPEPYVANYIAAIRRIQLPALLEAGRILEDATHQLWRRVQEGVAWPEDARRFDTRHGAVFVGTPLADTYAESALLILDPGGDDLYEGAAGSADGLNGSGISAVVDLAGDDRYRSTQLLAPGAALFGVSSLRDESGHDDYRADYAGQGAGLFGVAWLQDFAGDDAYRAHALAQGNGYVGVGILRDISGRDVYDVGLLGQGCSGILGVGLLIDEAGNDRFVAGGRRVDHERHDDRYLSLSQGFSIGMRPYAGGGVAALVDLAGNDTYEADIYGQGVSYWYSVGLLLDAEGNDTYHAHHYSQGSGIHMSLGLLADGAGNDKYTGYILAQGNAHDYAVGMLFDKAGNDTYTADHLAQGMALNNSFGLLVDSEGNDAYFGRKNDQCQGVGNGGGERDYGSLAILMDLEGRDQYSCGATNGAAMQRPLYGVVYDLDYMKPKER